MHSVATDPLPVLSLLAPAFTNETFTRAHLLAVCVILTTGRRTVSGLLRIAGGLAPGAASSYHRVLSSARWSGLRLAALLTRQVILRFWPAGTIPLVGDDTVCEHPGGKVHGKARHRDPVRSSHSYTAWRWGHKWVVLAVLVPLPGARRPWALPILVALSRSPKDNEARGKPHRTPARLMRLLLGIVLRWYPKRQFTFAGDSGYGSHEVATLGRTHAGRLAVVSKFVANANLYEPAGPYKGTGRRPQKGDKSATPQQVVATSSCRSLTVKWYGGGSREVEVVSGVGLWYKSGQGVVEVRWVYVHDVSGTHRDDYLYSTDVSLSEQEIIETYTGRWNIETTFAEMRAHLGLETTRGHCRNTVLRAEPSLFGLYSVVTLLYVQLPPEAQEQGGVDWEGKQWLTFSDALGAVRCWLWRYWVFERMGHGQALSKLPGPFQQTLLNALAPAA